MTFDLPDLPDGTIVRLASDRYQWMLQQKVSRKDGYEWQSFKWYSGNSERHNGDGFAAALESYVNLYFRLSNTHGAEEANRLFPVLTSALHECLGGIKGMHIRVSVDE